MRRGTTGGGGTVITGGDKRRQGHIRGLLYNIFQKQLGCGDRNTSLVVREWVGRRRFLCKGARGDGGNLKTDINRKQPGERRNPYGKH